MIKYIKGNIFDSTSQCIINPVNTVGVMGAGLALQFKIRYPEMFYWYKTLCDDNSFKIGNLLFWTAPIDNKIICCFPTKEHYKNKSKLDYIDIGLREVRKTFPLYGIQSVALPKLGCGLGGLDFDNQVKPLIEKHLKDSGLDITVYV